jgi:hypothetical protein
MRKFDTFRHDGAPIRIRSQLVQNDRARNRRAERKSRILAKMDSLMARGR